jgi:hypothetical protein
MANAGPAFGPADLAGGEVFEPGGPCHTPGWPPGRLMKKSTGTTQRRVYRATHRTVHGPAITPMISIRYADAKPTLNPFSSDCYGKGRPPLRLAG